MAYIIKIEVDTDTNEEEADEVFQKYVEALQTLFSWQWDNVAISSYKDVYTGGEEKADVDA